MNQTDHGFERELLAGLSRLADEAPIGPSPKSIVRRLRRRNRRMMAGAAAVLIAAVGVWLAMDTSGPETGPDTVAVDAGRVPALPDPLPVGAGSHEVETAFRDFLTSLGATGGLYVDKSSGQPISFAFAGEDGAELELWEAGLSRLLANFEIAHVQLRDAVVRYTLIAQASRPA